MIARTIRTPKGKRITPRKYLALHQAAFATDRAKDCEHGHFGCAVWDGGPCEHELALEHDPELRDGVEGGKYV